MANRFHKFQAIAEWIVRIDPPEPWKIGVLVDLLPCIVKLRNELVKIVDEDAGVSFAGGPEVWLYPEM